MKKNLLALVAIFLCLAATAQAQVYRLKSLEGASTQIRLHFNPLNHKFAVCYLRDTLFLHEYWSHKARILHGNLLEIIYTQRGGSNVGRGSTVLVCVSHNKLVESLHIDSLHEGDFRSADISSEYELYTAKLTAQTSGKLLVRVHDEYSSARSPGLNHNFNTTSTLLFNPAKHVFYSYTRRMSGHLVAYTQGTNLPVKKKFTGYAPAFRLGKEEYLFAGKTWYSSGEDSSKNTYYQVD